MSGLLKCRMCGQLFRGGPASHQCPDPLPTDAIEAAAMRDPPPVPYVKVRKAMSQIESALRRHGLMLVIDGHGDYSVERFE